MSLHDSLSVKLLLVLAMTSLVTTGSAISAPDRQPGFAGIEFYGSSQISRLELEKYLGLKPGATPEQITRAADRLDKKLAELTDEF